MPDDTSKDEAQPARGQAPVLLHTQVTPTGYHVQSNPTHKMVKLTYYVPGGMVDILLQPGKELRDHIANLEAAERRAASGLVIAKGNGKGIVGG